MYASDAQPLIEAKLVGKSAADLFGMYGRPVLSQVQEGHHVYYWQTTSASVYTPTYTAQTNGTIGATPYSETTTVAGDPQVSTTACVLVAGTAINSETIERVQLRGMNCGAFLRR